MALKVRPATLDDVEAINKLHSEVWFPTRSKAGWAWLQDDNPAQGDIPFGHVVVDSADNIAAFIGGCAMDFVNLGKPVKGICGHSMVAAPDKPGAGLLVLRHAIAQASGFGLFTLNNNALAETVYARLGGIALSPDTSRLTLSWVTNPALFLRAGVLRRYQTHTHYATARSKGERFNAFKPVENARYKLPDHISRLNPPFHTRVELADFWSRLAAENAMFARRDAVTLQWRFSNPDQTLQPVFLTYDRGDGVTAWLIGQVSKESEIAAPILTIIDLIGLSDAHGDALADLVRGAINIAKGMGLARVVIPHLSSQTLTALQSITDTADLKSEHIHAHIMPSGQLSLPALEQAWRATPYDGDYSFCLRQPPPAP